MDTSISTIAIPATVKQIERYAFSRCSNLETVHFALENCHLEIIKAEAFMATSISTVKILDTVKIEDGAFSDSVTIIRVGRGALDS